MHVVSSLKNPLLKEVRKAVQRGGLTDSGLCVAEGFHLLDEALRSGCEIASILVAESARARFAERQARVIELPDAVFRSISSTETSQGVVALVRPPVWTLEQLFDSPPLVVVLDGVQDPGNCGAIVRSAEAFGATGVAFMKGSANPYNPKCLRASAGSVFRVPLAAGLEDPVLLEVLERHHVALYALAAGGSLDVSECKFDLPCALIAGSEGRGVRDVLRARSTSVRIPTVAVESLNAALSAGIALYEARKRR